LIILGALLGGAPASSLAQVTRADSAAILMHAAESFRAQGRWDVAQALFQYLGERFGDTAAGARALAALRAVPAAERSAGSSQVELQVWSTLYGAWLGVAIPAALGADDPGPYGAGLLLGTPAGFFAGRALARSRALGEGQVRAITFGSLWGTWQGFGWLEVADWGQREVCDLDVCWVEDPDGEDVMKALVLGGLAGVGVGSYLARKHIPSGTATTVTFGGLWGTWFGVAGGVLAGLEDDDILAEILLAGNAGLLATAALAPRWNLTRERARLISIAGVVGGLGGAGLDLIMQPDDEKVAIAIPLLGSLAGLGLGAVWTRERREEGTANSGPDASPAPVEPSAALVSLRDGAWRMDVPVLYPSMVEVEGPRGPVRRPGLGITLLTARF
jgi:hypothetical protein